jgi:hypothetical protein
MPKKHVEKSAQTDPDPVLDRTTGLPENAEYLWYSGTLGGDAPGPSTYWVDSRITLEHDEAAALREQCQDGAESTPDVVADLGDQLDAEDFRECPQVAQGVRAHGWTTRAWISDASPVLVLALVGQG